LSQSFLQSLAAQSILITLKLAVPTLAVSLVVGLAISIFQAVTQIQEMTLTFIPKLFAVGLVGVMVGPWMLQSLVQYTIELYGQIPQMTQ
jgi:flagellar biosynthesis protein FliQ